MKKKIAIPTTNGLLDQHFGHCHQFTFFEIENNQVTGISFMDAPPHEHGVLPIWLSEKGPTDLIVGGIGQKAIQLFKQNGINVYTGAPLISPEEIITGFLNDSLSFSANYCDHKAHTCE